MRRHALFAHENAPDLIVEPLRIIRLRGRTLVKAKLYTRTLTRGLIFQEVFEWEIPDAEMKRWKGTSA